MNEARDITIVRIIVVAAIVSCIVCCAAAWIYQVRCAFSAGTDWTTVAAGDVAYFRLWQSDCLGAVLGHACYAEPEISVEGLPFGSEVTGVEWLDCHQSDLSIATQPTTPLGEYLLTIRRQDAIAFPIQVTLEIVAP